jgi:sugar phosphate isomerase/epimerase
MIHIYTFWDGTSGYKKGVFDMMQFSRRSFIKAGAAGLVLSSMPTIAGAVVGKKAKPRVGVQLYSVRGICKAEKVPEIFKALKEMGYAGVEFAGYYGKSAKDLKAMLDDAGLVACGTHTGRDTINADKLQQTIEFAQEVGNKYLMVPGMGGKTQAEWEAHAKVFSEAAAKLKPLGMYVGYHNHQHEFKDKLENGKCKWETLFSNAAPEVCSQMDIGHCEAAGEDPVAWLKKFPGRAVTVHAKEVYGKGYDGVLGHFPEGQPHVNWDKVMPVLEADVLQWYIVESEAHADTLEDVRGCVNFFKSNGRA